MQAQKIILVVYQLYLLDTMIFYCCVKLDLILKHIINCYCYHHPQTIRILRQENVVELCSTLEKEQDEVHRLVSRALRSVQRQEVGGRETVPLARRRLSGRYARSVRSVAEGLVGACQKNRFKVSAQKTSERNDFGIIISYFCCLFFKIIFQD